MRNLRNMTQDDARKSGWDVVKPLDCEVVGKAIYDTPHLSIMKSTKRFVVPGGFIYNTSTEIHKGTQVAVAEALVFVPELSLTKAAEIGPDPGAQEPPPPKEPPASAGG